MRDLNNTNYGKELGKLGYDISANCIDPWGRKRKFGVYPQNCGSINYFDSITDLRDWIQDVRDIRSIQDGQKTLAEKKVEVILENSLYGINSKLTKL